MSASRRRWGGWRVGGAYSQGRKSPAGPFTDLPRGIARALLLAGSCLRARVVRGVKSQLSLPQPSVPAQLPDLAQLDQSGAEVRLQLLAGEVIAITGTGWAFWSCTDTTTRPMPCGTSTRKNNRTRSSPATAKANGDCNEAGNQCVTGNR